MIDDPAYGHVHVAGVGGVFQGPPEASSYRSKPAVETGRARLIGEPVDLSAWIFDHYEPDLMDHVMRCKRCGQAIYYVTRHAAEVHGDDVEILSSGRTPRGDKHYDDVPGSPDRRRTTPWTGFSEEPVWVNERTTPDA